MLHLGTNYGRSVLRTSVILARHPVWNEAFVVPVAHEVSALTFQLKDRNLVWMLLGAMDVVGVFNGWVLSNGCVRLCDSVRAYMRACTLITCLRVLFLNN